MGKKSIGLNKTFRARFSFWEYRKPLYQVPLNNQDPFNFVRREWTKGIWCFRDFNIFINFIFELEKLLIKTYLSYNAFLVNLLSIASLVLKTRLFSYISMLILIVLNLVDNKNKWEHLIIKIRKVRLFFWQIVDIYLYSFKISSW